MKKQQIVSFRLSFPDYIRFEQLCCASGTNMNRVLGGYVRHCLRDDSLNLHHLVNDNPIPTNEPGGIGKQ